MSSRKLQTEIERTIKRVAEGIELFESIFEKILVTTNQTQKEKFEIELKKEIKKLQRFRDQIKTWASSNEIKDKRVLLENRRLIENQMEKFKALEKELKTKAYSQAGLNAASKTDPIEKEKEELRMWISDMTDKLAAQIDMCEAEQETLQIALRKTKKGDGAKSEKLAKVDHAIERHKHHQTTLEIILRMMDNGALEVGDVSKIREDVTYYVEDNGEPDFEEDVGIYDDLNLDSEAFGFGNADDDDEDEEEEEEKKPVPPTPTKEKRPSKTEEKEEVISPSKRTSQPPAKHVPAKDDKKVSASAPASARPSLTQTPAEHVAPLPHKYSAVATTKEPPRPAVIPPKESTPARPLSQVVSGDKKPSVPAYAAAASAGVTVPPPAVPAPVVPVAVPAPVHPVQTPKSVSPIPPVSIAPPTPIPVMPEGIELKHPPALADLVASFEKNRSRGSDPHYLSSMLESSFQFLPDAVDASKAKTYFPKQSYPVPLYYPQTPLPLFENGKVFDKLDLDTLFFIFYYRPDTYQQFLAARELKRQSWRFHKKFGTWFQRHEEPRSITEEYEEGTYAYFDYEGGWCQRKKSEFRFEYKDLEDENMSSGSPSGSPVLSSSPLNGPLSGAGLGFSPAVSSGGSR